MRFDKLFSLRKISMDNTKIFNDADWQIPVFDMYEFAPRRTKYCVVIPIINEGNRILTQLQRMKELGIFQHADILIADGNSTDDSTQKERLATYHVRTLLIKKSPGKLSAQLRMGYAYALRQGYAGIITIDGNGKDNPEAIPHFIIELDRGVDFVQGSRFVSGGKAINTPFMRWMAIRFIHAPILSFGAHFWFTDTTNGFRGYSRKILLDERVQPFRNIFMTYELLVYLSVRVPRLGYKTKEIPVTRAYPSFGKIPTKIKHGAHIGLIIMLLKAVIGEFNPSTNFCDV